MNVDHINQRSKDIVYGYIRKMQKLLPCVDNPYYRILKPIQNLCLIFFHVGIDSEILSDSEKAKLSAMIEYHYKKSMEYSLLWRASRDGFDWEDFYGKCDGISNTLCIIQSKEDNVFGGFTSVKWSRESSYEYQDDPKACIYSIRSNQGLEPKLYPVKDDQQGVIYQCELFILTFGVDGKGFWINEDGSRGSASSDYCKEFDVPASTLNGKNTRFDIIDIEVFQVSW